MQSAKCKVQNGSQDSVPVPCEALAFVVTMDFATMFRSWTHSPVMSASSNSGSKDDFTMSRNQQCVSRSSFKQMLSL